MVAGASRGLGYAVAEALARDGAQVSIASRDEAAIKAAAARLGGDVLAMPVDVRSADAIRRCFKDLRYLSQAGATSSACRPFWPCTTLKLTF